MICSNISRVRITKASRLGIIESCTRFNLLSSRTVGASCPSYANQLLRLVGIGRRQARYNYFKNGTMSAGDARSAMHGKPLSLRKQWEMMIAPIWPRRANYRSVTLIHFCRAARSSLVFRGGSQCTFCSKRRSFDVTPFTVCFCFLRIESVPNLDFYSNFVHSKMCFWTKFTRISFRQILYCFINSV